MDSIGLTRATASGLMIGYRPGSLSNPAGSGAHKNHNAVQSGGYLSMN